MPREIAIQSAIDIDEFRKALERLQTVATDYVCLTKGLGLEAFSDVGMAAQTRSLNILEAEALSASALLRRETVDATG